MRALAIALAIVTVAATARAEPADWAGFRIGAKVKKAKSVSTTLYGCPGTVTVETNKKKQVTSVVFDVDPEGSCMTGDDFDPDKLGQSISDAITKDMGGATAVPDGQGDTLWEGTGVSIILTSAGGEGGDTPYPELRMVAPDTSGKRTCWPHDGFAEFYAAFTQAAASGGDLTPYFKLPFDDETGELGKVKKGKDLKKLLTDDTKQALADPNTKGYCQIGTGEYIVDIPDPHGDLTAAQVKGAWKFVSLDRIEYQ